MTHEKMRLVIAEHCGAADRWVVMKHGFYYRPKANGYTSDIRDAWIISEAEAKKHVYSGEDPVAIKKAPFPDYPNDLNAMHEAENRLSDEKFGKFAQSLKDLYFEKTRGLTGDGSISAPANERCEAFIRTIGKWEDE